MYSSVNNHDENKSILSFGELMGIIAVFSFVLYLLFPKGNIEDFLETQGNNNDLSINYLQSMILYHPESLQLKMILIEKYTLKGEEEKALQVNRKLIETNTKKELLSQLYKIEYLLEKTLYFKNQQAKKLKNLKEKLLAYYAYTKGERDYLFFFSESTNIDYKYLKYHSLKNFMEENPNVVDYELEKMAFDLANGLGYEDEAYGYLKKLIKYPEISNELSEYLIYSLFEHAQFSHAKEITSKLFLESTNEDDRTKFFHLALYALVKDQTKSKTEVSQLIQDYANVKVLRSADIVIILNTLLELGDSKEASNFAINMFYTYPESFDETGIDLALQSLLYNTELQEARALSFFAEAKFNKEKYLDKTILLSGWLGESDAVSALNKKGYHKYKTAKYEQYFLEHEDLDNNYEILGKIYKRRIAQKSYKFIDNLADYYDYTGKINEAENYFRKLSKQSKHKKADYYAIDFTYKNSHFKKGLNRYKAYRLKYGIEPKLHEQSIQKLLALKEFKEAYALSKMLDEPKLLEHKQRFVDLALVEKDYAFLHTKLWNLERNDELKQNHFETLILLEKALNKGAKLEHLYKNAWEKTNKGYYLNALLYKLLQEKEFNKFKKTLKALSTSDTKLLNKDIEFQTLLAEYHVQTSNIKLALNNYKKIFKLNPNRVASHQSYLWFLLDNQEKYPKLRQKILQHLKQLQKKPHLRAKIGLASVVAAMHNKKYKLASYWLSTLIQKNPKNKEYRSLKADMEDIEKTKLYALYDNMINETYTKTQINLKNKHLGSQLNVEELSFSYQWQLYQNIKSKVMLKNYRYNAINSPMEQQNTIELSLKKTKGNFLWEFHLGEIQAKKDFRSSSLDLKYKTHNIQLSLESKYQNKTTLTPRLEQTALENALALNIQANISNRTSFSFLTQKSEFINADKLKVGTAQRMQLSANYVLRSGYPDISFNTYLSHNTFSKDIAQDFSELGISSSIGKSRQNSINSSWKPFGSVTLAINDEHNLGSSLSLGISKTLQGNDSLDLLLDYYNGIGVISEPIYGLNVKYRF